MKITRDSRFATLSLIPDCGLFQVLLYCPPTNIDPVGGLMKILILALFLTFNLNQSFASNQKSLDLDNSIVEESITTSLADDPNAIFLQAWMENLSPAEEEKQIENLEKWISDHNYQDQFDFFSLLYYKGLERYRGLALSFLIENGHIIYNKCP